LRILAISDTHIPRVAEDLPGVIYEEAGRSDLIVHAGDFVCKDLLDRLSQAGKLVAVYGNMDSAEVRKGLRDKEVIQAGKFRIGLIHGYGAPKDLIDTVGKEFPNVDAVVFGHSHQALNMTKDGVLYFNPGSPTDNIFASVNSYGIIEIDGDSITGKIVTI
jgi:putative phosphoesterase